MKKSMLLVATCLFMTCGLFAQNSAAEINAELKQTDIEKFMNDCSYTKTEYVEEFKTKSCEMDAFVVTDLKTGKKMGGIQLYARPDIAAAVLTMGAAAEGSKDLGYLDVSEIDDVLTVLKDIVANSNTKAALPYAITYVSKSELWIRYSSELQRLDILRTYHGVNAFGTPESVTYSTNDITVREVGKIIMKLESAKAKIEKACNQ
jgi:hypothetical protein